MIRRASITAAAAVTLFAGCATLSAQGMQGPAPTVPVAKTVLVSEQGTKQYIGKLVSTHAVDLKARVSGYLVNLSVFQIQGVIRGKAFLHNTTHIHRARISSIVIQLNIVGS